MKKTTLFCFFAFFLLQNLTAQYAEPLVEAEQMPYFAGCDNLPDGSKEKRACSNRNLVDFISQNLNYPAKAKSEGTEGTVYVSFVVATDGRVHSPALLYDIGGDCGNEALRVVNTMPPFQPAVQEGKPVEVKLNLPVQFSLQNAGEEKADDYFLSWGALQGKTISREDLRENLTNEILVRDREGNAVLIDELVFTFEKNEKVVSEKSRGEISEDLEKIATKAKKGGNFIISATVQAGGEFIYVDRSFLVTE